MIPRNIFNNLITFIKYYYYLYLIQPYTNNYDKISQKFNLLRQGKYEFKNQKNKLEESMNQLSIKNKSLEEENNSLEYEIERLETKVIDLIKENQTLNFKIENIEKYKVPSRKRTETCEGQWPRASSSSEYIFMNNNIHLEEKPSMELVQQVKTRRSEWIAWLTMHNKDDVHVVYDPAKHEAETCRLFLATLFNQENKKKLNDDKILQLQNENKKLQERIKKYEVLFEKKSTKKSNKIISLSGINNKKHGTGPTRYKEGDKYYHGVGKNETQKWNWKNKYNHHFFEYKMDHHLSNPDLWDTYNAHQFCSNCSYDEELSKNRRIMKIYKCNGHEI